MTALEVISNSFIVEVTFGLGCYATIGREAITKHDGPFLNIIICKSIAFHLSALYLEHVYTPIHHLLPYLSSLLLRRIRWSHLQIPPPFPSHTLHTNISRKSAVKKNRFASLTTCSSIIPVLFSHLYVLCSLIQVQNPGNPANPTQNKDQIRPKTFSFGVSKQSQPIQLLFQCILMTPL